MPAKRRQPVRLALPSEVSGTYGTRREFLHQSILVVLPTIAEAPSNVTVQEGNDVTLMCSDSSGVPIPKIFWRFRAKGSNVTVNKGPTTDNARANNLPLVSVQRENAGTYTCFLENRFQTLRNGNRRCNVYA